MKKRYSIFLLMIAVVGICFGLYYYRVTEKVYIELKYLDYAENVDTSFYSMENCSEFTWWEHYEWFEHKSEYEEFDTYMVVRDKFNIELPDNINWEKNDIVISYGRELKTLYYFPSWDRGGMHIGRPIFLEEHKDSVAYIYLIDKMSMRNNQFATDDMYIFNLHGEIPFTESESGWVW